ncbi:Leucine Rich Repeat [Seminavis robusta]|uniref:Leucine Rich Repeat n=1 Tax=Seminavis robusta TaxID=568900 RepID=A0A9N8HM57_9STRA|nr:Leucine Rich Repeat [Seminavis robusta]|eukprot:Sro1086_g239740.1 Leucine Rich Repeat (781) ;mRNA; r:19635-21977
MENDKVMKMEEEEEEEQDRKLPAVEDHGTKRGNEKLPVGPSSSTTCGTSTERTGMVAVGVTVAADSMVVPAVASLPQRTGDHDTGTSAGTTSSAALIKQDMETFAAVTNALPSYLPQTNPQTNPQTEAKMNKKQQLIQDDSELIQSWAQATSHNGTSTNTNTNTDTASAVTPTARDNSRPGAFPVGSSLLDPQAATNNNLDPTDMERGTLPEQEEDNSGLMEAKPVQEEAVPIELPTAQEFDQERHRATKSRQQLVLAIKGMVVAMGLLVLVIVIPVVLLRKDTNTTTTNQSLSMDEDQSTPSNPTVSTTTTPSPNNRTQLEQQMRSLLPPETVERINIGNTTPQGQAFQWLVQEPLPSYANDTTTLPYDYPDWRLVQRFALATLYSATNGPNWFNNDFWLDQHHPEPDDSNSNSSNSTTVRHKSSECHWFSRYSFNIWPYDQPQQESACDDDDNHVYTKLSLHENNLQGELPPEIYLLTSLTSLSLYANPRLQGTISTWIGQLTNLQRWYMAGLNGLSGTLPSEIGKLTNIQDISLIHNRLTGTIPTHIGRLVNLTNFFGDGNHLTGTLPLEIGGLSSSLRHFYLFGNTLTGPLPSELGNLAVVEQIALDVNAFSGTLPTEMGRLTNLDIFNLGENNFVGPIPSELGLLTAKLGHIKLFDNRLSGTLPVELAQLSSTLQQLRIHHNHFSGTLASELGLLTNLERLLLQNNSLSGSLPTELAALSTDLLVMDVSGNPGLSGTIPDALCDVGWNITCPYSSWECKLSFDCSVDLCGCDCAC